MPTFLFDLDGTLTEPFIGITSSVQYALKGLGAPVPEADELRFTIGPPLGKSFEILLNTAEKAVIDEAVRLYRERYAKVGLYENYVYDGIPELLTTLRNAGHVLFVCTSKLRPVAEQVLEHFKLAPFFSKVYGSEADGRFEGKVELLAHLLDQQSVDPNGAVMIGDRMHDLIAARENGVRSIAVMWGHGSREELEMHKPWQIVETPVQLGDVLAVA
ncbi:HAD hydrolase-like protein [Pseudovibrio exalbescens]|uniref:HAD hydrolase-like protein n=1 Tax=Pseudovibrio exalbescens TaxID=197461 RepID=UPI002366993F|nr:HAD hydrolase-like protein [Pseudovibrio exalbescens]MDD7910659.1 HAD hydrolase-like protein [Pseudovibrio exalbescens]